MTYCCRCLAAAIKKPLLDVVLVVGKNGGDERERAQPVSQSLPTPFPPPSLTPTGFYSGGETDQRPCTHF